MSVKKELLKATGLSRNEDEDEQEFFARVVRAANKDLSEDAWDALSAEAQTWVNDGAAELNAAKSEGGRDTAIRGFDEARAETPDAEDEVSDDETPDESDDNETFEEETDAESDDEAEEDEAETEAEPAEEVKPKKKEKPTVTKTEKPKAAKPAKTEKPAKEAKAPKAKKEPREPRKSCHAFVRECVIKRPSISAEDVVAKAKAAGFETPAKTVEQYWSWQQPILKQMAALGYKIVRAS